MTTFSYRSTKNGQVLIRCQGRVVTTLRGEPARALLGQAAGRDEQGVQELLRRATGNFKHGNEKAVERR